MRARVSIDEKLLAKATELTGCNEASALIRLSLEVLIARGSARRLALLGGTDHQATAAPRQRVSRNEQ